MTRTSTPLFAPQPPTWLAAAQAAMQAPADTPRLPLWVNGQAVGSLVAHFLADTGIAAQLGGDALLVKRERSGMAFWSLESPTQHATALLARLADALRDAGRSGPWRNEQLAVQAQDGSRIGTVERGAVRVLGIATLAVHLVGVAPDGRLWVQQRAANKANYPLHWDTLMGGMVSAQDSLAQALARETWEEAGLRVADLQGLRHGGVLQFRQPDSDGGGGLGYMHEDIHWYAATVPAGIEPRNQDGEVAQFALSQAGVVEQQLAQAQFTPEAALVWAGFCRLDPMTETVNKQGALVQPPKQVVVVGAGVVGVATALALQSYGVAVTLLDRGEPGMECSYGNSGAISPGSLAPLALPGILKTVPGMLLDPDGPLSIGWRHLPKAAPWLLAFTQSATPERVAAAAQRLNALYHGAVDAHAALAQNLGVPELFVRRGHVHLYPDADYAAKDATGWKLRAQYGYQVQTLDRAGIEALEPHAPPGYAHGRYLADHGTILNPLRYVQAMLQAFVQRGGTLVRAEVQAISPDAQGWAVHTGDAALDAQRWPHIVVAAGAWAPALLKPLGFRLPVESQRGYHAQFAGAQHLVERTVVLADKKVFIAPMEGGLRVGGTVEIAGLKAAPNPRRAAAIERIAREAFPALAGHQAQHWMGHRPCMPGSVPVVGPVDARPGLWLAVGHGHLGLTGSLPTAQRLATELCGPQAQPFWQLRMAV